jgi:hypothetical protein
VPRAALVLRAPRPKRAVVLASCSFARHCANARGHRFLPPSGFGWRARQWRLRAQAAATGDEQAGARNEQRTRERIARPADRCGGPAVTYAGGDLRWRQASPRLRTPAVVSSASNNVSICVFARRKLRAKARGRWRRRLTFSGAPPPARTNLTNRVANLFAAGRGPQRMLPGRRLACSMPSTSANKTRRLCRGEGRRRGDGRAGGCRAIRSRAGGAVPASWPHLVRRPERAQPDGK